jgi:hypothetical protein
MSVRSGCLGSPSRTPRDDDAAVQVLPEVDILSHSFANIRGHLNLALLEMVIWIYSGFDINCSTFYFSLDL